MKLKLVAIALLSATGLQALQFGTKVSFCVSQKTDYQEFITACLIPKNGRLELTADFYPSTQFFKIGPPEKSGMVVPDSDAVRFEYLQLDKTTGALVPTKLFLAVNPDGSLGLATMGRVGFTVTNQNAIRAYGFKKLFSTNNLRPDTDDFKQALIASDH